MLIKFKSPDPRAGSVVQMDSSLGQQFIDAGSAELYSERPEPQDQPARGLAPADQAPPTDSSAAEPRTRRGRSRSSNA